MLKQINDIYKHKHFVSILLEDISEKLIKKGKYDLALKLSQRNFLHDVSKVNKDEFLGMAETVQDNIHTLKSAIDLHYIRNSHHPEYWENNLKDMTELDIIELVCDWYARSLQFNSDFIEFLVKNQKERFHFPSEICNKIIHYYNLINNYNNPNKKIFLGGTCNNSTWRNRLIKQLTVKYFNPVVDNWTDEARKKEEHEKENSDINLYVITPLIKGTFSIAEVVSDSYNKPHKTVLCLLKEDDGKTFDKGEWLSLEQVGKMVQTNGSKVFYNLEDTAKFLNK